MVFDAYGTLVEITDRRRPFKQLLEQLPRESTFRQAFAQTVMSEPMDLEAAAIRFGIPLSPKTLDQLHHDLDCELASIRPFSDVIDCLHALKQRGVKLAVCSNLAKPYAIPVQRLIPMAWDAISWSFEVGAIKPHEDIYASACQQLGVSPCEALMVGDSEDEDYVGPLRFGMQAMRLRRGSLSLTLDTINSLSELPNLVR
ncbi:HAD family hydrolase [Dyella terrae]|uniref:HAD family hydrolase n=1 Tax=Dyella terrae TaxID=522259 RepID=UPI0013F17D6F|nr:HAD family hydrolase [Dyella terrae]